MTYQVTSFMKFAEQDSYEGGCDPSTTRSCFFFQRFESFTKQVILTNIMAHFDVKRDAVLLDEGEEPGRIDISRTENSEGNPPTDDEILLWKLGKWVLWQVTYTGHLEYSGKVDWVVDGKLVTATEGGT